MVNVTYTLWRREYDDKRESFLYTAIFENDKFPAVERDTIDELVESHISNPPKCPGGYRTPDEWDLITTIPSIRRNFRGDHTNYPADANHLKEFERLFIEKKAKIEPVSAC